VTKSIDKNQTMSCQSFQAKDYKSDLKPIWCPGCGDFGVVQAIYRALAAIGRPPHEIAFVSGIGCSSRIPGYTTAYGFNTVHGRALPIAQGIKLANPELLVLAAGGDGDGFSIGGGHVAHVIRRNVDMAYIVMDNQIYGLTKGQLSPTSPRGLASASSSYGSIEDPVNPLLYVLGYGARFVAQGTPADMPGLATMIEEAIRFPGFAFVNVQSPCITFGQPDQQLKAHKAGMVPLQTLGHDASNRIAAMDLAQAYGATLYTGVFYRDPNPSPTYGAAVAERHRALAPKALPRARVLEQFVPRA
jgi:2-oxoglutarate ferredoxin oxidoreductase subunit beta